MLRLNMSHIEPKKLKKTIQFVKKNTKAKICIDTEGAQIRVKVKKQKFYKLGKKFKIYPKGGNVSFYPQEVFKKLKVKDQLSIGFVNLNAQIIKKNRNFMLVKVISSGHLENNKGVHLKNRVIHLNYLTKKDSEAIKIAKKLNIKNYALSFTNTENDVKNFNKLLPGKNKIYKIETKTAIKNLNKIMKHANQFLIDRGDLSKDTKIENIPVAQRKIFKISKKYKFKNIFVATNLLENMMLNEEPTRSEANDIFSTMEMGAAGLVLAAETAIGKNPYKTIYFLKKIIRVFQKNQGIVS